MDNSTYRTNGRCRVFPAKGGLSQKTGGVSCLRAPVNCSALFKVCANIQIVRSTSKESSRRYANQSVLHFLFYNRGKATSPPRLEKQGSLLGITNKAPRLCLKILYRVTSEEALQIISNHLRVTPRAVY